ncbi:MAG TPA: hypothetical protein DHV48_20250 [Prolixibacteraceae bacterium]|nr:hypothetical protein [Prolixibacteraceae bacterium]
MKQNQIEKLGRRQFLSKSFIVGTSCCLGCNAIFPNIGLANESQQTISFHDRISKNTGMTYDQVFAFAYRDAILPQLIELSNELGRDKLIGMLKKATDKVCSQPDYESRLSSTMPKEFWSNVLDIQVLENTASTRIYKITNCLWAKVFREAKAEDIGYALVCYGDYAIAKTNNKTLERDKTLMQGNDCCMLKWTKSG